MNVRSRVVTAIRKEATSGGKYDRRFAALLFVAGVYMAALAAMLVGGVVVAVFLAPKVMVPVVAGLMVLGAIGRSVVREAGKPQ